MIGDKTQSVALVRIMEIYSELLDISHATIYGHQISGIYYKDRNISPDELRIDITDTLGSCYYVEIRSDESNQYIFDHTILEIIINVDNNSKYSAILKLSKSSLCTDTCVELFKQGIDINYTDVNGKFQIMDRVGILRKHTIDKIASYHEHIR